MIDRPMMLNGYNVQIADPVLVKKEAKRSWKERLLTLPFRPFCKLKTVSSLMEVVEDGQVIKSFGTLIMSAKTYKQLTITLDTL